MRERDDLLHSVFFCALLGMVSCTSSDQTSDGASGSGAAMAGHSGVSGAAAAGGATSSAGNAAVAGFSALAGGGGSAGAVTANAGSGNASSGNGGTVSAGGNTASAGSAGTASAGSSGAAGNGAGGSSFGGGASSGAAGMAGSSTSDPPCPVIAAPTGGKQYCSAPSNGSAGGKYSYDLWSDNMGSGCITVYGVDAAFKANWMNVGDWIARVGLSFDKTKTYSQLGTFASDFSYTVTGVTSGGFGNVGIYGWTVNPLHEFYIEENWLGKAPNFTKVGSFTIDGEGTYEVMTNTQTNQPNITGTNATFVQFWSVRTTPRTCGHISVSKHFDQWAKLGLTMGMMEEARISVEGQNNSGTIDFTKASLVVTP